jgi:hypothetical protein
MLAIVGKYFANVLCAIALRDLAVLVDKYMRRCLTQLARGSL